MCNQPAHLMPIHQSSSEAHAPCLLICSSSLCCVMANSSLVFDEFCRPVSLSGSPLCSWTVFLYSPVQLCTTQSAPLSANFSLPATASHNLQSTSASLALNCKTVINSSHLLIELSQSPIFASTGLFWMFISLVLGNLVFVCSKNLETQVTHTPLWGPKHHKIIIE